MTEIMQEPLVNTANVARCAGTQSGWPDFGQLVLVTAEGTQADVLCFDRVENGAWRAYDDGASRGFVGTGGLREDKREGDGATPQGLFRLGFSFGIGKKPDTRAIYRRITEKSFWVDDPGSAFYNMWVESNGCAGWRSAEHLIDYPDAYAYAVVIGYNTDERIPGLGSAVFLHCGKGPTCGCVAVPGKAMLAILTWLDPARNPHILLRRGN